MEHLNRLVKDAITGLGANKATNAIDRVGKAIGTITNSLDIVNNIPVESGHHSNRSSEKKSPQDHQSASKIKGF